MPRFARRAGVVGHGLHEVAIDRHGLGVAAGGHQLAPAPGELGRGGALAWAWASNGAGPARRKARARSLLVITSGSRPSALVEKPRDRLTRQERPVLGRLEERARVGGQRVPPHRAQPIADRVHPGGLREGRAAPPRLLEGVVQEDQVRGGPGRVAQVPDEVVEVAALGPGPLQDRVELAGQERGAVVVLEAQEDVPPDDRGLEPGSVRGPRVHLELHREGLLAVAGEAHLVEQAGEAHERAVDDLPVARSCRSRRGIPPARGPPGSTSRIAAEVVAGAGALQGEVEVLRVARDPVEEAKGGAPLEGQGDHRARPLQRAQDLRLEELPGEVAGRGPRTLPPQDLAESLLHRCSSTSAARWRRARRSFGRAPRMGWRSSSVASISRGSRAAARTGRRPSPRPAPGRRGRRGPWPASRRGPPGRHPAARGGTPSAARGARGGTRRSRAGSPGAAVAPW